MGTEEGLRADPQALLSLKSRIIRGQYRLLIAYVGIAYVGGKWRWLTSAVDSPGTSSAVAPSRVRPGPLSPDWNLRAVRPLIIPHVNSIEKQDYQLEDEQNKN